MFKRVKNKREVTVIGLYPDSRSAPRTLKCEVREGAAHTTINGEPAVLPLDGTKAYEGPTYLANLDKGCIIDFTSDGDALEIDALMLAIWADNHSSHRINQFDEGLNGLIKSLAPWATLVILIIVIVMAINMYKNGGGL